MRVFLFPGQGAQRPGMGTDLLDLPEVASAFGAARSATGIDAARIAAEGTEEEINDPLAAQVLACALSVGVSRALEARGVQMDAAIGFSLGEVSALIAAGALDDEEGFALLNVRARALAAAAASRPGAMLALLGASHDDAQAVCNEQAQGQILVCANYNAPGQVVISGDVAAIDRAEQAWKADKRRCARLATAGAFHSPLMAEAAAEVGAFARTLRFTRPRVPVYCNTDAAPFVVSEAAERLAGQVENPVLFEQSVARLIEDGADEFVETGFGGVLFGLVKRINRGTDRARVGTCDEFDSYVDSLPAKL